MKAKVTKYGIVIPKDLLEGVNEVEIRKDDNLIVVIPTTKSDPILELGKHPVACGISDASKSHDKYIYGSD
ncbi:MAG: hypothetical protein AABY79_13355 [Nitrospirota bacterium]